MARNLHSIGLAAAAAALLLTAPAIAQPQPDATLDLTGRSAPVGAGPTWGGGMLHYRGKDHPLKVSGVTVTEIGAKEFSARGDVLNLRQLNDINGTYHSLAPSAAATDGAATLENDKGVQIKMVGSSPGLRLRFAREGVSIKLDSR